MHEGARGPDPTTAEYARPRSRPEPDQPMHVSWSGSFTIRGGGGFRSQHGGDQQQDYAGRGRGQRADYKRPQHQTLFIIQSKLRTLF